MILSALSSATILQSVTKYSSYLTYGRDIIRQPKNQYKHTAVIYQQESIVRKVRYWFEFVLSTDTGDCIIHGMMYVPSDGVQWMPKHIALGSILRQDFVKRRVQRC